MNTETVELPEPGTPPAQPPADPPPPAGDEQEPADPQVMPADGERPELEPPAPDAPEVVREECVVDDGTPHMGRAVNGAVCSAHANRYRSDGTPREALAPVVLVQSGHGPGVDGPL